MIEVCWRSFGRSKKSWAEDDVCWQLRHQIDRVVVTPIEMRLCSTDKGPFRDTTVVEANAPVVACWYISFVADWELSTIRVACRCGVVSWYWSVDDENRRGC